MLTMQIADLDGLAHYEALGISKAANAEAIKKASEPSSPSWYRATRSQILSQRVWMSIRMMAQH